MCVCTNYYAAKADEKTTMPSCFIASIPGKRSLRKTTFAVSRPYWNTRVCVFSPLSYVNRSLYIRVCRIAAHCLWIHANSVELRARRNDNASAFLFYLAEPRKRKRNSKTILHCHGRPFNEEREGGKGAEAGMSKKEILNKEKVLWHLCAYVDLSYKLQLVRQVWMLLFFRR